jgi:phosphatidate cytidylyltransferase
VTTPSLPDRPGAVDPPGEALTRPEPPVGAPSAPVGLSPAQPEPGPPPADATGRIPITGERPVPPPPFEPVPVRDDDALPETEKRPGRAGRDLGAAIAVGLGLGAIILASLLVYRPAFLVVVTAAVLVGVVELTHALRAGGFRPPLVPVVIGAVGMMALAWTRGPSGLVVAFLFTVLAVLLWRLADGPLGYLMDSASGVLVAMYVPLLAGFAILLLVPDDGVARILIFMGTVVCSDVGGYAAGVLFGKHPMAPHISPKKSWEGMAGSVVACVLCATLIVTLTFHGPWWGGVVFGIAIAISATVGDLGESLIKRDLGIKDMGHLLPGHGGIMDRLDSLLPSAALAYLLLTVFVPA